MATEVSMVTKYGEADYSGRVDILLDNYETFLTQIELCYEGIKYRIKEDRAYERRKNRGELGIRVQTSGHSSPTETEAIENIEIEEMLKSGDFESDLLKYVDDVDQIKRDIYVMQVMKLDFGIISLQRKLLSRSDQKVLVSFLDEGMTYEDIARKEDIEMDSARSRVRRAKGNLKIKMMTFLETNGRSDF